MPKARFQKKVSVDGSCSGADAGCIRCHNGPNFSDSNFYRLSTTYRDRGRGAITGEKRDNYAFRTPGLRDVARTVPYMHDRSMETLDRVVEFYYRGIPSQASDGLPLDAVALIGQRYSEIARSWLFWKLSTEKCPGFPLRVCVESLRS